MSTTINARDEEALSDGGAAIGEGSREAALDLDGSLQGAS